MGTDRTVPDSRARSRRRHLLRIWADLAAVDPFPQLDRWLAQRMRRERSFGKRDRQWYTEALFTLVRFAYPALFLEYLRERQPYPADDSAWERRLDEFSHAVNGPAAFRTALFGADFDRLYDVTHARALYDTRSQCSGEGPAASDTLLSPFASAASRTTHVELRLAWHGAPSWVTPFLAHRTTRSGWDTATRDAFIAMQSHRPPAWLRLPDIAAAKRLTAALRDRGYKTEATGLAVRVANPPGLQTLEQLAGGPVHMQDLASQGIGDMVTPQTKESVWDCCTGGGGKALQIATRHPSSRVYASDIRGYKLGELCRRAERGQVPPITTVQWDAARETIPPFAPSGGFDWVLVDAPCSGSGTWRRNPDGRLRWAPSELDALTSLQRRLLHSALRAVRPGGHVVYATCSWFVEENEDVVEQVLERVPSASLQRSMLLGCPGADADTAYAAVIARTMAPSGESVL